MKGWIALHRKIREHWIWQDEKYFQRWCDLLMLAAWEPTVAVFAKEKVQLKRGQLVTSVRTLMHRWETNNKYDSRFFTLLEDDGMIQCLRHSKYSVVTIVHFDQYQMETATPVDDEFPVQNHAPSEQVRLQERQQEKLPNKQEKINSNNTLSNNTREEEIFGVAESKMNFTVSNYCEELKRSDASIEQAMLALRRDKKCVLELIDTFLHEMQFQSKVHIDFNDFKKHFINWAKIQLQNEKRNGNGGQKKQGNNPDDQLKRRRGTDVGNHKASDYGGPFSIQPDSTEGV